MAHTNLGIYGGGNEEPAKLTAGDDVFRCSDLGAARDPGIIDPQAVGARNPATTCHLRGHKAQRFVDDAVEVR